LPERSEIELGKNFGQIVDAYERFRPGYPAEIFHRIANAVSPPRRRLVDLGIGTGKLARGFLQDFDEIIGVEPDQAMAEKLSELEPRIEVRLGTAEEIAFAPSTIDAVTVGHALHWMDPAIVLSHVTSWLRSAGVFAVVAGGFCPPEGAAREIIDHEFEEKWAAFRDPRTKKQLPVEVLGSKLPMKVVEHSVVSDLRTLTVAQYSGYCRSTSHGNAYARSLADPEAYWRDFESRLRAAEPGDQVSVDFSRSLTVLKKS
jgi:SAM-dependent methyltransferase